MDNVIMELEEMRSRMGVMDAVKYASLLKDAYGKRTIVGIGAGRMGYSLRGHIMRLSHLGFDAYMIGDTSLPRIDETSIVIINSSSGRTPTNILYAQQALAVGATIVAVTYDMNSPIAEMADLVVQIPEMPDSKQPMKTIYEQFTMLLFDFIAGAIIEHMKLDPEWVAQNHSILE